MTEKKLSVAYKAAIKEENIDQTMTEAAEEIAKQSLSDDHNDGSSRLICFVCTGNTCRSPMAAAWLNHILSRRKESSSDPESSPMHAISAGIFPHTGDPISRGAIYALEKSGVESTEDNPWLEHTAVRISEDVIKKCEKIIAISGSHAFALITEFPKYAGKIFTMPHDISDPFGGSDEQYIACLEDIKKGIGELFGE